MIIYSGEDERIGYVTSGTMSPVSKSIGMGYIHKDFSKAGSTIFVDVRNTKCKATVVKLPFVEAKYFKIPN